MSISISKAQKKALSELESFAGDNIADFNVVSGVLEQYGALLQENIAKYADEKQVVASGELLKSMASEIEKRGNVETFRLRMLDYYDYTNEGVKGVASSRNAPNSPYQYKNYGMPDEAKASLKRYIQSGRAKISSVRRDVALGIGLEKKGVRNMNKKSLIDRQVDTMAYMIKKYGIKATNYFNLAFEETFKDFEVVMTEAVGEDIVLTFESIKKK
jgi:hypothetical protein